MLASPRKRALMPMQACGPVRSRAPAPPWHPVAGRRLAAYLREVPDIAEELALRCPPRPVAELTGRKVGRLPDCPEGEDGDATHGSCSRRPAGTTD